MHRLWFVDNVKRHMPFSCRQQTTNSASRSLLAVAQFHTHPFLFYILHHFLFTVLYFCCSHIGFLSALPLRIFTAKVQVVRHTSNRASMDASENLPLYVPYRVYFSLPICLNAFQLLCMAEKYPSDKPKGSEKREIKIPRLWQR